MKNSKYKILVLSDLKAPTKKIIPSTIALAKMIDGQVDFFHAKKPTEIVKTASQLSARREINDYSIKVDKKIKGILESISKNNLKANYSFSFGNVKDEIKAHINKTNPDIIVMGKRKSNPLSFIGDSITDFVLKNYEGAVFIASTENTIEPNSELSLGFFNSNERILDKSSMTKNLFRYTKEPLKSFSIGKKSIKTDDLPSTKKKVEYVFEENSNIVKTLSGYIKKNKINLLCVDRKDDSNTYTKDIINSVNVSVLVV